VSRPGERPRLIDFHPPRSDIRADVIAGLSRPEKMLPPKYFYDERGSKLFEDITHLPEYYLTRTEDAIMEACLPEMASLAGPGTAVIEFGSGTGAKIRRLLSHLESPVAAITVEISRGHLEAAAARQAREFPDLEIIAVCADFMRPFDLPEIRGARRNLVFFPGSTIGNFPPSEARQLLRVMHQVAGEGGALLIGVDLDKDKTVLEAAYNDAAGVTAAFNLNLLQRINAELGADFDMGRFCHQAVYNTAECRIEMYLVSQAQQQVRIGDRTIAFAAGERILTEYSHKYRPERFEQLADEAGFRVGRVWTDERNYFSVQYLIRD
jgi:dimethylhistidine N-methyltransferase